MSLWCILSYLSKKHLPLRLNLREIIAYIEDVLMEIMPIMPVVYLLNPVGIHNNGFDSVTSH